MGLKKGDSRKSAYKTHRGLVCTQKTSDRNDPLFLGGSTMRWTANISVCFTAHSKHEDSKVSLLTSLYLTVLPSVRT